MKKNFKIGAFALSAILAGGLVSCTSDQGILPEPTPGNNTVALTRAPEIYAYSNGLPIAPTSNAGDGYIGNTEWDAFGEDAKKLTNITPDEREAVLEAIKKKVTGSRISEDVVFPWENYFLQDVISGQNGNFPGAGSNGTSSSSYTFEAWNTGAKCNQQYWPGYDYDNYEEVTNSAHLNNYYQRQESNGSQTRINETTLMKNMKYGTYEEMKGKQFRWFINCHENLHWYEYIVVQVDGSYYICFDFGCGHPENDVDGNPGKGAEYNDWDYNDWILKITPAGVHEDVWTGQQEPEDPDPEDPEEGTPDTPAIDAKDHVEVNFEVEEHKDYLATHLSIHIRAITDVEIFIPIEKDYFVEADDLAIVQKHEENLMVHAGPTTATYNINGNIVTLTVTATAAGYEIETQGVTEELINLLKSATGDGITFEVWNYYNKDAFGEEGEKTELEEARKALKGMLDENHATVKFTNEPSLYVNAFFYDDLYEGENGDWSGYNENQINPWDCTVDIVPSQKSDYEDGVTGWWYNTAPYNMLYEKKTEE